MSRAFQVKPPIYVLGLFASIFIIYLLILLIYDKTPIIYLNKNNFLFDIAFPESAIATLLVIIFGLLGAYLSKIILRRVDFILIFVSSLSFLFLVLMTYCVIYEYGFGISVSKHDLKFALIGTMLLIVPNLIGTAFVIDLVRRRDLANG